MIRKPLFTPFLPELLADAKDRDVAIVSTTTLASSSIDMRGMFVPDVLLRVGTCLVGYLVLFGSTRYISN